VLLRQLAVLDSLDGYETAQISASFLKAPLGELVAGDGGSDALALPSAELEAKVTNDM
jgi:hypothetical protein